MEVEEFLIMLRDLGGTFYTGVPDSLLSPFIDGVMERYGISEQHIVAANEGAAVGLAAGHYLATSQPAVVYMQNSGIGNAVNPICSLLHPKVFAIPAIFVIGWRGEPGTKDEPQHLFQGEATLSLLDCLEVPYIIVSKDSNLGNAIDEFKVHLKKGQSVAFVIRKGALHNRKKMQYVSDAFLSREEALKTILSATHSVYVCTTGKLSREVFEIREQTGEGHKQDFLTVGSMGHSLMIAYGIAIAKPNKKVFCLDGDGAVIMHMGSMAVVGVHKPENLVHIVINNGAHETVGGVPAVSSELNLCEVARSLGYCKAYRVSNHEELKDALLNLSRIKGPVFIEIMCNLNSRVDLGRPNISPLQNRNELMKHLAITEI